MAPERVPSPFFAGPVAETPLERTPLVAVIVQVRFPMAVSRIQGALKNGDLQSELSEDFPFANQQDSFNFLIQPGQPPVPQQGPPTWVLQDESGAWTCNVAADSISLTSAQYESRADVVMRSQRLFSSVERVARPPKANRVGVRYLNRVEEPASDNWLQTLAVGARGILSELQAEDRLNVETSFSQVLYHWSGTASQLQGRWGVLPPYAAIDAAMPPVSKESWVLDIDSFSTEERGFRSLEISNVVGELASRAYTFFRWVVTPEGLTRFRPVEARQ